MTKARLPFLCTTGLLVLSTHCANVTVRKVPTPSQYVQWTDQLQREADELEGFRFYLPRPFLNVHESFPVRTDIYLADARISPDGKYLVITRVDGGSGLNEYMSGLEVGTRIPSRKVTFPDSSDRADAQGALEDLAEVANADAKARADVIPTGRNSSGSKDTEGNAPGSTPPVTGQNRRGVTNNNNAVAYQPLRGSFDIAYLPDFDEQYVVSSWSGLGNAEFELNLGQGWSLQGFNSLSDNSELNKRIFDLIDTSIDAAKAAAAGALGAPPPAAGLAEVLAEGFADAQGAIQGEESTDGTPAIPVTLKIVVVHYAAKGLYPVIKPRELQERTTGETEHHFCWDIFELIGQGTWATNYDQTSIQRAQAAISNETGNFTVPRYPYQYVSMNTFRYMAIEVLETGNNPFGTLYDETGTRRDTDSPGSPGENAAPSPAVPPVTPERPSRDGDLQVLRAIFGEDPDQPAQITLNDIGGVTVVATALDLEPGVRSLSVSLEATGGPATATTTERELKEALFAILNEARTVEFAAAVDANWITFTNFERVEEALTAN